eukprot:g77082.t1
MVCKSQSEHAAIKRFQLQRLTRALILFCEKLEGNEPGPEIRMLILVFAFDSEHRLCMRLHLQLLVTYALPKVSQTPHLNPSPHNHKLTILHKHFSVAYRNGYVQDNRLFLSELLLGVGLYAKRHPLRFVLLRCPYELVLYGNCYPIR